MSNVFSPRDYFVSSASDGYFVFNMTKSPAGLTPVLVADYSTWEEAARKTRLLGLTHGVNAWGRRDHHEGYVELVMASHPQAPWTEPWHVLDREVVNERVPRVSGIYLIGSGRPAFVGATDDLQARLLFHLTEPGSCLLEISPLLFSFKPTAVPEDRLILRSQLVRWWEPRCNSSVLV